MPIISVNLSNINLNDARQGKDDPDVIIIIRLLSQHIKFERLKALKKELNEETMPVAQRPKRWFNFCMSEDEEKKIEPIFRE